MWRHCSQGWYTCYCTLYYWSRNYHYNDCPLIIALQSPSHFYTQILPYFYNLKKKIVSLSSRRCLYELIFSNQWLLKHYKPIFPMWSHWGQGLCTGSCCQCYQCRNYSLNKCYLTSARHCSSCFYIQILPY